MSKGGSPVMFTLSLHEEHKIKAGPHCQSIHPEVSSPKLLNKFSLHFKQGLHL
jgi:hypothetical protein